MSSLLKNIRFYVLCLTGLLIVGVYAWVGLTVPGGNLATVKLAQGFGLLALAYFYISLLITPLYDCFPRLPWKRWAVKARRAIGFSTFLLALFHVNYSFFGELGGFEGLGFLNGTYLLAIGLSSATLLILALLAATSFDYMVRKMGKWWRKLHMLAYLGAVLIVFHVLLLGSHFIDLSNSTVAHVCFALLAFLLLLEAIRVDHWLERRFKVRSQFGAVLVLTVLFLSLSFHYLIPEGATLGGINVHATHIELAKEAQQGGFNFSPSVNLNSPAFAGLRGDKSKRYTVSFTHPDTVQPGESAQLGFQVFDASTGFPVSSYTKIYDRFIHLVVVSQDQSYFQHIHPDFKDGRFQILATFPKAGLYHLYINYQPFGAIEQQQGFSLAVGQPDTSAKASQPVDGNLTKTFGDYKVTLTPSASLKASELSIGGQTISFKVMDASGKPITTLKPYLASYGHLTMIRQDTFDYLHVHPNNLTIPAPDSNGGPTVTFLPLGLYGPISPGIYRLFAEFNPDGHLFTADFTIKIN
jgi:DMSO/TMAO reductase YedYZ heme-binding membrane subunit